MSARDMDCARAQRMLHRLAVEEANGIPFAPLTVEWMPGNGTRRVVIGREEASEETVAKRREFARAVASRIIEEGRQRARQEKADAELFAADMAALDAKRAALRAEKAAAEKKAEDDDEKFDGM